MRRSSRITCHARFQQDPRHRIAESWPWIPRPDRVLRHLAAYTLEVRPLGIGPSATSLRGISVEHGDPPDMVPRNLDLCAKARKRMVGPVGPSPTVGRPSNRSRSCSPRIRRRFSLRALSSGCPSTGSARCMRRNVPESWTLQGPAAVGSKSKLLVRMSLVRFEAGPVVRWSSHSSFMCWS